MFISSGIFAYPGMKTIGIYELCLKCIHIASNHEFDRCMDERKLCYEVFEKRDLGFKDFEHFYFKRHQFLSSRRI